MPKVPILSRMQTSSTEVPGVAFSVVSASQVWTGNIGALIAKAMKKPAKSQRCVIGSMSIAARSLSRKLGVAGVGRDDVEADHRGEHHEPAAELVDQELRRRAAAPAAPEAADEEVRRDQRGLEDDVEQQHVGRREDGQRHRLEGEGPGEERLRAAVALGVGLAPAGEQDDRHEDDGQQHHEDAEPVDAERVVHAERLDPGVGLGELHARVGLVLDGGDDAGEQRGTGEADADQSGDRGRRERRHERADQRQEDQDGQRHARFTARRARTTSSAPARTDRA